MARKSRSISKRLNLINVLIENVNSNEGVKTSLFGFGYAETLFNKGETMYADARSLITERTNKNKEKLQVSRALRKKISECEDMFSDHRELAKRTFSDNQELLSALGVTKRMSRTFAGLIEQGLQFYNTAIVDPVVQEKLTPLGLTLEKLQQGLALFKEANKLNTQQEEKKGEVQKLTVRRNKKFEELFAWASNLVTVLRMVYKDEPQTLEQFEILVYSEGYSPKKKSETNQSTEPEPTPETPPETPPTPPSPSP
jgi:hypothetical protein